MAPFYSHTSAKTLTPLFDCIVNHALVQAFPFLNDILSQLLYTLDFPGVDPLLKKIPYLVIDGVEVGLFGGHSDGGMKPGVSRFSRSTVS